MNETITLKTIKPKDLKTLRNNQKKCKKDEPITTRATFKLFELEALLQAIKGSPGYTKDHNTKHSVCITFVRERVGKIILGYDMNNNPAHKKMLKNLTPDKKYTQLIPIITGCECMLHSTKKTTLSFKYLSDKKGKAGVITFVRPGGEGTGLIPPPPTGGDE